MAYDMGRKLSNGFTGLLKGANGITKATKAEERRRPATTATTANGMSASVSLPAAARGAKQILRKLL